MCGVIDFGVLVQLNVLAFMLVQVFLHILTGAYNCLEVYYASGNVCSQLFGSRSLFGV